MDKKTEALKLALEALEECRRDHRLKYEHPYYDKTITAIREALAHAPTEREQPRGAATLAQHEPVTDEENEKFSRDVSNFKGADPEATKYALKEFLKNRTTQPQEPVIDHSCKDTYELIMKWADIYAAQTGRLYSEAAQDPTKTARMADERTMLACAVAQALSQPVQQQEPHCYMDEYGNVHGGYEDWMENEGGWFPVYTSTPASKPWVGLSEQERNNIEDYCEMIIGKAAFEAIEAKLKEKNNG